MPRTGHLLDYWKINNSGQMYFIRCCIDWLLDSKNADPVEDERKHSLKTLDLAPKKYALTSFQKLVLLPQNAA